MRKFFAGLLAVMLAVLLVVDVSAATGAVSVGSYATVSSDGGCQVSLTATIHLDQAVEALTFPVPKDATDVKLNGSRVRAKRSGEVRQVNLSKIVGSVAGDFSINIQYTLYDVVQTKEDNTQQLELPLLSGFAYPVEKTEFSITLPGEVTTTPTFTSGYHQTNIEKDMQISVSGAVISGVCNVPLKDRETLALIMSVTDEMFPRSVVERRDAQWEDTAMLICAGLALVYWLIFLRNTPPRRRVCSTPPDGYHAGLMGSVLTMDGMDLTMAVLSWAQLGYILIQVERSGRVLLHKRMEMGNERSSFEQRCFKNLFGTRRMVDTSGLRYAQQCQALAKTNPGLRELVHPRSGNAKVFRGLAAGAAAFGGASLGFALGNGAALQIFLVVLLGILGGVAGFAIQAWAGSLFLRDKQPLYISLGCCGLWLLLGIVAGDFQMTLWAVLIQLLAGLMAYFGGRRTDMGRQIMAEVLGLRRYLYRVPKAELQRICQNNPDYFYSLAPYALALDADRAFAKRFGSHRLSGCPYLTTGMDGHLTAMEWSALMRRAVKGMDQRARQMPMEKWMGIIQSFLK